MITISLNYRVQLDSSFTAFQNAVDNHVLVSGTNSLVHVHLVFSGGTLLHFVYYSIFDSLSEDSARWGLAPWKD